MKISADMGHGYVKIFDGERIVQFEAVLGETQGDLMGTNTRQEIATNEGHWYVGQTALKQSVNKIMGKDEDWAFQPEYRALLLYGISEYVSPSTDTVTIDLVSGLPIVDYRRNRDMIKNLLCDTHLVRRPGRRNLKVTIRKVLFLPQGFAPAKPFLALDRKVATLDLGSRNISYATFDGSTLIDNQTNSEEIGATSVLIDISKRIEQRTKRELTIPEVVTVLQTKVVRAHNQPHDVSDIIDERLGYYLRAIDSLMARIFGNAADIDTFVVFGGGAYLAGNHIKSNYPNQVELLPDTQQATVRSQYDYGLRKL